MTNAYLQLAARFACLCLLCGCVCLSHAETPDTITFVDGEQLAGKLIGVMGGTVTFHSDVLGNITVPILKVKEIHSAQPFAIVAKDQRVTRKTALAKISVGTVSLESDALSIHSAAGETSLPAKQLGSLIDVNSFHRELRGDSHLLYGWGGSITLGASIVKATNSAQTYNGAVALARSIPTTGWLPPSSKITLNLNGTYGLSEDSEIFSNGAVYQSASVSKTDILHGDTEYDRYISPVIFALVNASADHNFGNGLRLQQADGFGLGWSVLKKPKDNFDVKAGLQYEQQQFYNGLASGLGTPSINLSGAFINENWARTFSHGIKFNEYVTLTPTFNIVQAYSAVVSSGLVFPVYKKLNFTVSATDDYLGDPPQGFRRKSFQFNAGVTYVLK